MIFANLVFGPWISFGKKSYQYPGSHLDLFGKIVKKCVGSFPQKYCSSFHKPVGIALPTKKFWVFKIAREVDSRDPDQDKVEIIFLEVEEFKTPNGVWQEQI